LRSGQLLNKSELARDVGISPSTANEWLSVLAASNQITLLEPWFANGSKSIVKSPKLYLNDTGLMLFLLNISGFLELSHSPYAGAVWETFAFSELRKRQTAQEGGWSLFFWRDRGCEVDFVIHRGGRFELLEAKWSETPTAKDEKNLLTLSKILGEDRILKRSILCRAPKSFPLSPETRAVSLLEETAPPPVEA
jgi:predicted AAA+ superfamily ATPase